MRLLNVLIVAFVTHHVMLYLQIVIISVQQLLIGLGLWLMTLKPKTKILYWKLLVATLAATTAIRNRIVLIIVQMSLTRQHQ